MDLTLRLQTLVSFSPLSSHYMSYLWIEHSWILDIGLVKYTLAVFLVTWPCFICLWLPTCSPWTKCSLLLSSQSAFWILTTFLCCFLDIKVIPTLSFPSTHTHLQLTATSCYHQTHIIPYYPPIYLLCHPLFFVFTIILPFMSAWHHFWVHNILSFTIIPVCWSQWLGNSWLVSIFALFPLFIHSCI